jgi:hypothetical protein
LQLHERKSPAKSPPKTPPNVDSDATEILFSEESRREKLFNKINEDGTPIHPHLVTQEGDVFPFYNARTLHTSGNQHKV